MVEKMKLLHITGPKEDIDRVMKQYISRYEIHFENAMTSLGSLKNISPFVETNIYKETWQEGQRLKKYLHGTKAYQGECTIQEAEEIIRRVRALIAEKEEKQKQLEEENNQIKNRMAEIAPFIGLDFEIEKLREFHFIDYRFGRITLENYHKLQEYIYKNPYTLFYECNSDQEYVWAVYFAPHVHMGEQEAVYASFHFEEIPVPEDLEGTPREAFAQAAQKLEQNKAEYARIQEEIEEIMKQQEKEFFLACEQMEAYCENFEIRKYAACTREQDGEECYILYGWMAKKDAVKLEQEMEQDEKVRLIEEEADEQSSVVPPTRLKNPRFLKPFEMFVEMYGLPAYNEMDPTIFIALTYTLMFGIMFGDVGQGLVLVLGGLLLYQKKGIRLAGIVGFAGIWSVFFGFMYGSFFGFEEVLPAIWMKPMDNIMTVLMLAIGFGTILILIAMVLNIVNAIRAKEYGRLLVDQSGVAGIICYGFAAVCIVLFATGHGLPAATLIGLAVGIPLIAILLKEPLSRFLEKKKPVLPEGSKVMFLVEAVVECFDVVLSYATNTISFVRVGAFALSHAGMMGVVMTLAGLEKGSPNWIIIILGNILVAGLEGLVVGIQVLRLEYYEMFSRFYKGTGKPFAAFRKNKQQ